MTIGLEATTKTHIGLQKSKKLLILRFLHVKIYKTGISRQDVFLNSLLNKIAI